VSDRKLTKPIASATTHILLITAILIVSLVILFSNPKITGRYFAPAETFSAPISEKFTSNSNYSFEIPQEKPYNLKALKISGLFTGEGTAKVYLKTENETYLVFDSSTLTKNSASVSGLVTGALTDVLGNSPLSSSSDGSSAQPASPPSSEQANAQEGSVPDTTGQGGAGADNSAPAGNPPAEQPPTENQTQEQPVNETQPIEIPPENITIPENVTGNVTENQTINPENITNQTQELAFTDRCVDTCLLPDGLAGSNYTLEIQVENGELSISEIKYSLQNLTDIPVNITVRVVDSNGQPVDSNISLVDDSGASVATGTTQGQTIANEIFSQPAQEMPAEGTNSFETAPSDQNNLVVDVQTTSVPIQKIEFQNIDATADVNATIGVDAVPENKSGLAGTVEVYAIDPTQIDFATAVVTVTATGNALYKCASWDFDNQTCTDGIWTFVQAITPGQPYEITLTQGDPAYSEIINITKAAHLDENKTFISDIYEQVNTLDGIWSETISDGHYVRITFQQNLTSGNDITLYPKTISGSPKIDVYELNQSSLIAEFSNITDNAYNKVYLTNLSDRTQNTFDLHVLSGSLQFDYIVDPTNVSDCANLTTTNEVYTLTGNVNSSGTCFTIGANNVTLDCQGYTVNYSTGALGYGVNNSAGYNFTTVKNCTFVEGSASGNSNYGIYYYNSYNGTIYNNIINTYKTDTYGIYLYNGKYHNISNNTITAAGNSAYTIYLRGVSNSVINTNNLYANSGSSGQYALYLYNAANNNTISYNTVNATSASACIRLFSSANYNNIIYNNVTTGSGNAIDISGAGYENISYNTVNHLSGAGWGIYLNTATNSTVFYNNLSITGSSSVGIYLLSGANYNDIEFNNISSSGNGAMGMQIRSNSNSNYFNSNNILANGSDNVGVRFRAGSTNNGLNNHNILTSGTGGSYPIDVYDTSNNFTISNSKVNASSGVADFIIRASPDGMWNLTNVTKSNNNPINISWTAGQNGTLYEYWYLDANVTNQSGIALSGANISVYYGNSTYFGSSLTDSNGAARFTLLGFMQNSSTSMYYSTPYIVNVSKSPYANFSNSSVNMTNNIQLNVNMGTSDSTPPTVTIIRPENITYNTQSNIPLNYTATDNVAVSACWYAMNGGTNTSLPGCSNATFSTGIDGSYPITVYANDTNGNVGSAVQYFTVDTTAPQWSSPNTNTPTTYSPSTLSLFNITWTGSPSSVLFESNYTGTPQNYSMYVISGNVYGYNATLPAGSFYWKSYANDSAGNTNVSSTQTFTINKATTTTQLYIDNTQANKTITYGTQTNATATTSSGSVTLYRDGTLGSNPEIATLPAGTYNYTAINAGNANYSASSEIWFLTVNKATPALNLLIDAVADNKTITYGTQSNATASESNSGDSDLTYNLYRNDSSISNPDVQTLGANTYIYTYNTSGGVNYTSAALSRTLTVSKAVTDVRLFLNGNEGNNSQAYGTNSNATATIDVAGLAVQFYRDGNLISNPEITMLAAGTYNYTAAFAGNENYTGDAQTYFLTINKAAPTLSLLINGEDSDLSVAAFTIASINASATTPGGATVSLYENNSLVDSGISPSASRNYTTLGNRIWKVNITESQNYTSAEKNHTLSVTDPDLPQYSNLKENPADPATYYPTHSYQFNATWTDNIAISNVILEFAGTNYSYLAGQLNKSGNEYYKSFSSLAAATYNYKWYANDTSNNWASTPVETYTIDKAVAALFLTLSPSNNINYGTTSTVSCSANNLESSPALTRNMTSMSNPDSGILAVGSYNYACTAAATQNYTSASATTTLTVSKATPTINLTLNGVDSDITLSSGGGNVDIIATLVTPDSGNLNLTQDGTPINSGASPLANISSFTSAGTYTLLASYAGNDNYTSGSKSHSITVQVASQPPPSGGGSTGGGAIMKNATNNITRPVTPPTSQLEKITKVIALQYGKSFTFTVNNESHTIQATAIAGDFVELEISSNVIRPQLKVNETKTFDLTNDGITDLEVTLLSKTESGVTLRITVWNEITTTAPSAESTYIPEYKPEPLSGSAVQVMPYKAPNPLYAVPTLLLLVLLFTILAIRKENLSERVKKMLTGLHIALIITIVVLLIFTFVKTPVAGSAIAIPTIKLTIPANKLLIGIPAFLASLTVFVLVWLLHLRSHSGKKPNRV
jgi:hypothetical protein